MQDIHQCKCVRAPAIHSEIVDDSEIYSGIICHHCDIAIYGEPLACNAESERVIHDWNELVMQPDGYNFNYPID